MKKVICMMMVVCLLALTACEKKEQDKVNISKDTSPQQGQVQSTTQENPGSTAEKDKQTEGSEPKEDSQTEAPAAKEEIEETEEEVESTFEDFLILETKSKVKIKRYLGNAKEVKIPETINEKPVTEICDEAFDDKVIVVSIEIPRSVNKIGRYAFSDTRWFKGLTDEFVIAGDGVLIKYNGEADKIVVPDIVKSIGYNEVFLDCDMSEIVIPDSVVYLNEGAFSHCNNLKSVVIPDSVVYLGDYLFYECSVTEITVPPSVKKLGNGVFKTKSPVTIYGKKGSVIEKYINGNSYFTFVEK